MDVVLNWLWQGSAVAIAAAVMLRVIGPARANVRYGTLWVAWLSVLAVPVVPFLSAVAFPPETIVDPRPASTALVSIPLGGLWNSAVVALWSAWSVVFACRIAMAMVALGRAKRSCRSLAPDRETGLRFWSGVSTTGRRTRLLLSNGVRSAAVLGCGSPVIALAPSVVDTLDDEELDRIVIHEWAHVQRYDDVAHVLQLLGRLIAGWHPAVWWLDRQLHLEREIACDEVVVAVTGSAKSYAACLAKLASLPSIPVRPLPAVGALSSHGLRARILRILRLDQGVPVRSRRALAGVACIALGVIASAVGATRLVDTGLLADALTQSETIPASGDVEVQVPVNTASTPPVLGGRRPENDFKTVTPANRQRRAQAPSAINPISKPATDRLASSDPAKNLVPLVASRSIDALTMSGTAAPSAAANGGNAASSVARLETGVKPVSPWGTAADAGVVLGRKSQDAAVSTAGFFTRFGRSIAGSF